MPDLGTSNPMNDLQQALAALPLEQPDANVWSSIRSRLKQKNSTRRARYPRLPLWLAAAASFGFISVLLVGHLQKNSSTVDQVAMSPSIEQLQLEAQQLQQLIRIAQRDPLVSASDLLQAMDYEKQITGIDFALDDHSLSAADRQALWQQRVRILAEYASRETDRRSLAAQGRSLNTVWVRNF